VHGEALKATTYLKGVAGLEDTSVTVERIAEEVGRR
jgi:hypothetical protein